MKISGRLLLFFILGISSVTCRRHRDPEPDKNAVVLVGSFSYKGGKLYAFDATNGATKWFFETQKEIVSSSAIANGLAFVGSENLYAVDINTGKLKWKYDTGDFVYSSPAVANGIVYVGCNNGYLYAINAVTGSKKWAYRYPEQPNLSRNLLASPFVTEGIVYINMLGGRLLAVDAETGTLKWEFQAEDYLRYNPKVANGIVYINCLHVLYAIDARSGKLVWRTPVEFDASSNPVLSRTSMYINSGGISFFAFDAKTGTKQWSLVNIGSYSSGVSSPVIDNNQAFLSMGEGVLHAIDLIQKKIKWTRPTGSRISSSPTVANGTLYVGNQGKTMYAVDAETGAVIWSKQLEESIGESSASVLTTYGKVYTSTNGGSSF